MNMISKITVAGVLLVMAAMSASAAENPQDFAYHSKIETDGKASWFQADIPIAVRWQAKYFDLRDLRVFNADGESLPFALTASSEQLAQDRHEAAGRLFPLYAANTESEPDLTLDGGLRVRRDTQGNVEIEAPPSGRASIQHKPNKVLRGWLIDASAASFPLKRLKLDWAADEQEGFFRFSIEASDDLAHWSNWGEGQLVRLVFDGQSIRQQEISLPERPARYLRLIWENAQVAPNVRGAKLSGEVTHLGDARLVWSSPFAGDPVPGQEREYIWHFPCRVTPQRVRVMMEENSVLAPVVFYGRDVQPMTTQSANSGDSPDEAGLRFRDVLRNSGDMRQRRIEHFPSETPWQRLASGVLYRLPANQSIQMENELALPELSINQLRLRIDRRGSGLGGKAPQIELAFRNLQLTFLPRGNAPYWLAMGNTKAQAADLPLTTLIPGGIDQAQQTGQLGRAQILGGDLTNDAHTATRPPQSRESAKIILWAILTTGVLLLAAMAFSLLRSIKKDDKSTDPKPKQSES